MYKNYDYLNCNKLYRFNCVIKYPKKLIDALPGVNGKHFQDKSLQHYVTDMTR
jgi:hypothetical protein